MRRSDLSASSMAWSARGAGRSSARHSAGQAPASRRRCVDLALAALVLAALAACKTQPSPWSPEVDKVYHELYGPIIDGG